jgi:hypothetical protein
MFAKVVSGKSYNKVLKQEGRNRMNELAIANIIGHKDE